MAQSSQSTSYRRNRRCGRWLIDGLSVTVREVAFVMILGHPPPNSNLYSGLHLPQDAVVKQRASGQASGVQRERHECYKYMNEKMHMMRSNMIVGVVY